MKQTIFISHSTTNDATIDTIAETLESAGFMTWVDHRHGIEPGTPNWDKAIRTAIDVADIGLFVMSEAALASDICAAECLLVRELGDPLYVLRLEDCQPKNVWTFIKMAQYADCVTDFDGGLKNLLRALNGEKGEHLPEAMRATLTGYDEMRQYLPYLSNPLRGREADLAAIQANLTGHVLQIVAPGGFGKSRLTAEIAQSYPHGAIWHRCLPTSQDADLLRVLRQHLRLPENADLPTLLTGLAGKRPLVVVDNAEDVATDKRGGYVALLTQLVGRGVPVILTARVLWPEFKPRREYAPKPLDAQVATQLALDFARSEGLDLTPAQAADLAKSGRLHPRLIEFAVGQLHERSLERVLRQLSELTHADVQEALDEMIRKSVRQMSEAKGGGQAAALLKNLTLMQGTFSLDAVQAVAPESLKDADELEDALILLGRWQFVRRDPTTERYSLAELVREALGQPDQTVFKAYAAHFTARADEIFTLPLEQWKNHDHDLPNILALGDELVTRHAAGKIDPQTALDFALNTNRFVIYRMEYRRLAWLEMGLAAARQAEDKKQESLFLNELGFVWSALGDKRKALDYYERALPIDREVGDRGGEAVTLNNIGAVWDDLGDKRKALDYYEQTLSITREVGDRSGEATTLNNIGMVWDDLGDKRMALDYYERALPIQREVGDRSGEATTLNNIGRVWSALGDKRKALDYYERALPIIREIGNRNHEAGALNNIGRVWYALGDKHKALDYYERALPILGEVGDRGGEATTLTNIGAVWSDLGNKHKALDYYERALPIRREVGDRGGEAVTLNNIGAVWKALGDKHKALDYYERALPILREVGDRGGEAVTCFNIGKIYHDMDDLDNAIRYVERSVVLAEQVESEHISFLRENLTRLKRKRGDIPELTPEEQFAETMTFLRGIYQSNGAGAVRALLAENGASEELIAQILALLGGE